MQSGLTVLLLDDDVRHVCALARELECAGHRPRAVSDADALAAAASSGEAACAIVEAQAGGASTLALCDELGRRGIGLPFIFLVEWPELATCVQAMRGGAVDFLAKPHRPAELRDALLRAAPLGASWREARVRRAQIGDRLSRLTPRERQVLALVLAGQRNKQIAAELGSHESTVKVHRSRFMRKLGTRSLSDLLQLRELLLDALAPAEPAARSRIVERGAGRIRLGEPVSA